MKRVPRLIAPRLIAAAIFLCLVAAVLRSAPPEPTAKIDYATAVRPIFQANCAKCHLDGVRKGQMDLGSLENLLKGGESEEPAVVPHESAKSRLIALVTSDDPDMVMPKKGKRLSEAEIGILKTWIDHGAPWGDAPGAEPKYVAPLEPRKVTLPEGKELNPIDRILAPYFAAHVAATPTLPSGQATQASPLQDVVDDRTYARRVYLDTIGLLPSAQQVDSFVNDSTSNKREKLVAQLLADNRQYAEHWMSFWNDCLRNDYSGTGYIDGGRKQITGWLYKALFDNMPYDQFVRELIDAKPGNQGFINGIEWRGAVSASQNREVQAAQNITQVFLGLNFKCNSCHDSFISDWKLADSYGLAGVFADKPMEMYRCEKPTGQIAKVKFLYPQLGSIDGDAPRATKVKQLAALMTDRRNGRFTRTIVNRLWARFMGRGIVEPVDEMDQKPWNADLLDYLASDLADHGYDLKRTIEMILTSHAYQMTTVGMHERIDSEYIFRGPVVRRMSAEQFVDALSQLTGEWQDQPASPEALALPQFALAAKWIWSNPKAREKAPPGTIHIRKEFSLAERPDQAIVTAAADNSYSLRINGKPATSGNDFAKPQIVDVAGLLEKGKNTFEVTAVNDSPTTVPVGESPDNPAGFWMLASMKNADGTIVEIGTDQTWDVQKADADDWTPASVLGPAGSAPWKLPTKLLETRKRFSFKFDHVRAVWAKNNPLMTALGRPNREQVVTNRFSPATMLQMLELTNGKSVATLTQTGAKRWIDRGWSTPDAMIQQMYREALGRAPTKEELRLSLELTGSPATQQGVEDLLWSLMMLPEFQLIY